VAKLIADNEIFPNYIFTAHLKTPNTHSSIHGNKSEILYTHSARCCCFNTSLWL